MILKLGDVVIDNIGNEWRVAIRQEHWMRQGVLTFMLIEESGSSKRAAQCQEDGSDLQCPGSAVVKQIVRVI